LKGLLCLLNTEGGFRGSGPSSGTAEFSLFVARKSGNLDVI
jgi:hypothetical protein